jgi:hypothetical protein
MANRYAALGFRALFFGAALLLANVETSSAGDVHGGDSSVRYPPSYKGYHLRPPYFLPGLGWYTPSNFDDRSLYFGYHFHPPGEPRTPLTERRIRVVRLSGAHVEWCLDRYASYRVSDNSFQPYHGARRQCRSPYR